MKKIKELLEDFFQDPGFYTLMFVVWLMITMLIVLFLRNIFNGDFFLKMLN
jgi:hypothetical protein